MYADEEVGSKVLLELLKAGSYSKSTVIYELDPYIVFFHCHVDDLLFYDHLTIRIFCRYQKRAVHING